MTSDEYPVWRNRPRMTQDGVRLPEWPDEPLEEQETPDDSCTFVYQIELEDLDHRTAEFVAGRIACHLLSALRRVIESRRL